MSLETYVCTQAPQYVKNTLKPAVVGAAVALALAAAGSAAALTVDSSGANIAVYDATVVNVGISGSGTLYFYANSSVQAPRLTLNGDISFSAGTLITDNMSTSFASGTAAIGELVISKYSTEQWARPTVFSLGDGALNRADMTVENLFLLGGTIAVNGQTDSGDPLVAAKGSVLMVKNLSGTASTSLDNTFGFTGSSLTGGTIAVSGNGTLVLGSFMDGTRPDLDAKLALVYAGFSEFTESQKRELRLAYILASSALEARSDSVATLITRYGMTADDVADIRITVGTVNGTGNGIFVGTDGRWILDYSQTDAVSTAALSTSLTVTPEGNAQLVLYGWNGDESILPDISGAGWLSANVYSVDGARAYYDGSSIRRLWCYNIAGLKASSLVKEVETAYTAGSTELRPGWRFIVDSLEEARVGQTAYANVVDGAVFLPAASGIMAADERAFRGVHGTVLKHDARLYENADHLWVEVWGAKNTRHRYHTGGSGTWGYESNMGGMAFGMDLRLKNGMLMTFAVSGATTDSKTTGTFAGTNSSSTTAAVTGMITHETEGWNLRAGLTIAQSTMEADQSVNLHRLHTEPKAQYAAASLRATKKSPLKAGLTSAAGDGFVFAPYAQITLNYARYEEGSITDTSEATTGVGFETQTRDRYWTEALIGATVHRTFVADAIPQYPVQLRFTAETFAAAGDTDISITSNLVGGTASSRATYEGAGKFGARLEVGAKLWNAGRRKEMEGGFFGFGQKETGKMLPVYRSLDFSCGVEMNQHSEHSALMKMTYRELF